MQSEEKSIIQVLYIFTSVALFGSALVLINGLLSGTSYQSIRMAGLFSTILCATVLVLLRAGKVTAAKITLPTFTYIIATALIFTSNEVSIRDEAVLLYALVVAMAGLLLKKNGVIVFGVLSFITVEASVFAEIQGWIVNHITEKTTIPATMVIAGVAYGLTFVMIYILVDLLTKNILDSHNSQEGLTAANEELVIMQNRLEHLANEGARNAEEAQSDAEAARHQAELQAWLLRGQAQLADKIRGDPDISTLSNHIISQVCQYIGAQSGALFVALGGALKLTGRYAYTHQDGQPIEFKLREGWVGETAFSKKIFHPDEIPADAPRITSGLGESLPRDMILIPLEYNGQVFGVLQIATLTQFSEKHKRFLSLTSESMAIALRSAQTRNQMNQLFRSLDT